MVLLSEKGVLVNTKFFNRTFFLSLASITLVLNVSCAAILPVPTSTPAPTPTPEWQRAGWELVWQDEFEGSQIDKSKWQFDIGGYGWGNAELEYYTDRPENARIEDGHLVIEARKEKYINSQYTSARLKTQG